MTKGGSTTGGTRILFLGDTGFGESYQARAADRGRVNVLETRGYESMLADVSDLLGSADYTVANLETPLTAPGVSPFEGRKKYIHWGDPRRTTAVLRRHGVRAVSLGNNHTFDYGDAGLRTTLDALGAAGIRHFGAGFHATEAAEPLSATLEAPWGDLRLAVLGGKQRRQKGRSDIQPYAGATPGVHPWRRERDATRVHALRQADPGRLVVAFPHWGKNYEWAGTRQRRLARALVDGGADLVLGHGSHMMGEIECYRGRWIIYSLGNFVFGSPGRYAKVDGAVPFSFAAGLEVARPSGDALGIQLRLYPIVTDNRMTSYRTRPVDKGEMDLVMRALDERSPDPRQIRDAWSVAADGIGPYLEAPVARLAGFAAVRTATRIERDNKCAAVI